MDLCLYTVRSPTVRDSAVIDALSLAAANGTQTPVVLPAGMG